MGLNFYFSSELVLNSSLLQLLLEEDLQGQDEHGLTFPGQINVTEFTLSKSSTNFEVV